METSSEQKSPQPRQGRTYQRDFVISELKRDFRFMLFFLLPGLRPHSRHWREFATELQMETAQAEDFSEMLFSTGLWSWKEGFIFKERDHLDLGELSLSEFMSMSVNLIARMHDNGPCWYETLFIATNENLKKEFYRKVNSALREFVEASRALDSNPGGNGPQTIVAWNHSGLDCLPVVPQNKIGFPI